MNDLDHVVGDAVVDQYIENRSAAATTRACHLVLVPMPMLTGGVAVLHFAAHAKTATWHREAAI